MSSGTYIWFQQVWLSVVIDRAASGRLAGHPGLGRSERGFENRIENDGTGKARRLGGFLCVKRGFLFGFER